VCYPSIQFVFAEEGQVSANHVRLCVRPLFIRDNALEKALIIVAERNTASGGVLVAVVENAMTLESCKAGKWLTRAHESTWYWASSYFPCLQYGRPRFSLLHLWYLA
jgi:hypothetical protein